MNNLNAYLDAAMCLLWIFTYLVVLLGTIRYRYPLMPLATQMAFMTHEIAILFFLITEKDSIDYVVVAYSVWVLIEISLFLANKKVGHISPKTTVLFICLTLFFSTVLFWLIAFKGYMTYVCYIATIIGVVCWYVAILKPKYPIKPVVLVAFLTKLIADIFVAPFYLIYETRAIGLLSVILPMLDALYIPTYFLLRAKRNRKASIGGV